MYEQIQRNMENTKIDKIISEVGDDDDVDNKYLSLGFAPSTS